MSIRKQNIPPRWGGGGCGPLTKAGHPRHPSRLTYSWQLAQFDIAHYGHLLWEAEYRS